MTDFKIGKNLISNNGNVYFIADIGANHDGDIERAYKLIELAKESGAHAAKFQNFKAPSIVSKTGFDSMPRQSHQAKWKKSVYEVYKDASVSDNWTEKLKEKCQEFDIEYFTSAYDFDSVDHADPYVEVYKIGSGDITWHEILDYTASKGKPMLIATGACSMDEVNLAMDVIMKHTDKICLMQCNTNYTASDDNFNYINLNVLKKYKEKYPNAILGLSDHTLGHATVLGSIALGARVIEKHFTDSNKRDGPDHKFAMNPMTWKSMVDASNELMLSMGDGIKKIEDNELSSYIVQRRGLWYQKNLPKGHVIKKTDLKALRPMKEDGYQPYEIENIIGRALAKDVTTSEYAKKGDFNV